MLRLLQTVLWLLALCGADQQHGDGLAVTQPLDGAVVRDPFVLLAFDVPAGLRSECAVHLMVDGTRVAHWIADPQLPARARPSAAIYWAFTSERHEHVQVRRPRSVRVLLGAGPHRAHAIMACIPISRVDRAVVLSSYHMRNLSRWTHWDESSCESIVDAPDREGELHGACVYSRSVSFSVAPRAASDPGFRLRVVMKFPGATAVVKRGEALPLVLSLSGTSLVDQVHQPLDDFGVYLVLKRPILDKQPPDAGNSKLTPQEEVVAEMRLPCDDFQSSGHPGSAARLLGARDRRITLDPQMLASFLEPRAGHASQQGMICFELSIVRILRHEPLSQAAVRGANGRRAPAEGPEEGEEVLIDTSFQRTRVHVLDGSAAQWAAWERAQRQQARADLATGVLPPTYCIPTP